MTIAERIRVNRTHKKLSQSELVQITGINLKSLSRYEIGATIPPADALKKIADALEITADALLGDEKVIIKDRALLKKFEIIQQMTGQQKEMVLQFLDMAVRDFKAKQAYS